VKNTLPQTAGEHEAAKVWVISDGRPGHLSMSRGIVAALARLRPVREHWIDVKLRIGAVRQVMLSWLFLSGGGAPLPLLRGCFRMSPLPAERPDAIVSAGGNTAYLNVALARRYGCANLFAGSLRGLRPQWFTAVIGTTPMEGVPNGITMDLAPTTIDPEAAAAAGDQYRRERGLGERRLWAMIIGGHGGGYRYDATDWQSLAAAMNRLAHEAGVQWLLTTSRRTGAEGEAAMRAQLQPASLADAVWWASEPRKVVLPFLGAAERVFCTEDSATMLAEAMSASRPVYSLAPRYARPDRAITSLLQRHVEAHRLCRVAIRELGDLSALPSPQSFQLVTASMTMQLAQRLTPYFPTAWSRQTAPAAMLEQP
jgi:mitochondrial fission protein ELM1